MCSQLPCGKHRVQDIGLQYALSSDFHKGVVDAGVQLKTDASPAVAHSGAIVVEQRKSGVIVCLPWYDIDCAASGRAG